MRPVPSQLLEGHLVHLTCLAPMPDTVISVESLSKSYVVGHQSAPRKAVDLVRGRQIVQGDEVEEFWALKDVSFEVKRGEVLGIIGCNGAGKSTLLKVLSRITEPTRGRIKIRGRVASLLEVRTGFHPELTGRENNGAVLRMKRAEIKQQFDEIVAFAEVERFLDTPVKHYSSGMYVRLAFAVAAHLEPEILIMDEVLAVGDAEFQKDWLRKMNDPARGQDGAGRKPQHWRDNQLVPFGRLAGSRVDTPARSSSSRDKRLLGSRNAELGSRRGLDDCPRSYSDDDRLRLESLEWLCDSAR